MAASAPSPVFPPRATIILWSVSQEESEAFRPNSQHCGNRDLSDYGLFFRAQTGNLHLFPIPTMI